MSSTQSTTSDSGGLTELAQGLQEDLDEDHRSCPHDCHGSLSLMEDNKVICETCRCTPDGVYIPLDDVKYYDTRFSRQYSVKNSRDTSSNEDDVTTTHSSQYEPHPSDDQDYTLRIRNGKEIRTPDGPIGRITSKESWDNKEMEPHGRYDYSHYIRMAGGYEIVYDQDDSVRPWGVDDSYTYDLSTL